MLTVQSKERRGKSWQRKIALTQLATAKFRRKERLPEAGRCIAVIIALMRERLVGVAAVAATRIVEEDNGERF